MAIRNLERVLNHTSPGHKRAGLGTRLKALEEAMERIYLRNAFVRIAPLLTIKAAESPTVKSTVAFNVLVAGTSVSKSANTDMAALAGTLADGKWAAWAFEMGSNGTPTITTKTADKASEIEAVAALPAVTANAVRLGYIVVGNGSGANFVGGTTALDATGITAKIVSADAEPAYDPEPMV